MQIYSRLTVCLSSVLWSLPTTILCNLHVHTHIHTQSIPARVPDILPQVIPGVWLPLKGWRKVEGPPGSLWGNQGGIRLCKLSGDLQVLIDYILFLSWKKFHSPMGKWMQLCAWRQRWVGIVTRWWEVLCCPWWCGCPDGDCYKAQKLCRSVWNSPLNECDIW